MARPATPEVGRRRLRDVADRLRSLLPDDWKVVGEAKNRETGTLTVTAADGTAASLYVIATDRLEPRDLDRWRIPVQSVVSAPWISPRTRELLHDYGAGYVDATGNVELRLSEPALFIRTTGDDRDPNPRPRRGPSLKGPRAWALQRTLIEVVSPYTAGELAIALKLDDGYVSRALQVLVDERLIERRPRGPVTSVEWEGLLRRVTRTYSLLDANQNTTWIAAAGPDQPLKDLGGARGPGPWAVTGSFVAASIAPVAAPEVATIFTEDPERLAKAARLLPASTGANVILARPYDPIVFQRGRLVEAAPAVSVAQAAMDTLTGPGRMPAEGEALLTWMRRNEPRWRWTELGG